MSVTLVAEFTAKSGKLDEVLKHVYNLRDHAVDKEPGTLVYIPTQDPENDHKILIFENYASQEAFEDHKAQKPFVAFSGALKDILDGELSLKFVNKL